MVRHHNSHTPPVLPWRGWRMSLSVIATTSSFLDKTKSEKLAHFEVKDRTLKLAIRIKSEPDGPGFKLTLPASKMSVAVQKLSFDIGRKRNLLFVHMYRHGSFSVNVGLFTKVFGCGKHSLSPMCDMWRKCASERLSLFTTNDAKKNSNKRYKHDIMYNSLMVWIL